ncbi:MAG: hypothetical protein HYZ28_21950 [Myxococcales bacterium]|nr:hypothetical protein [Myxococcales bacterium]
MQDRYTYDIGDYAKCGLLRHLVHAGVGRLGMLWYFTRLGSKANDGRHVDYLERPELGECDPELFQLFRRASKRRSVESFERCWALPEGTAYAREEVPPPAGRAQWFSRALQELGGAELVFCDPDNGIATERMERIRSPRHVLREEIEALWGRGHSLVLYHHCGRARPHAEQIGQVLQRLGELRPAVSRAARFRRYSARVFFVLGQRRHASAVSEGLDRFAASPWVRAGHFELV